MKETRKASLKTKFQYHFDNYMASGPRSIFLSLLILFVLAFVLTSLLRAGVDVLLLNKGSDNILNDLWLNFLQITDPGAIAEDGENPVIMKTVGIISTFMGLIFFSGVIAFITTQLDLKIEMLKRGKSTVIEKNHVLILGWGEMVIEIIKEIIEANRSEKRGAVVILSGKPKEEMDEFLNERITKRYTTKLITRTGNISSIDSLNRVGIVNCKSIIILPQCNESAPEEDKIISDAMVLKSILGVVAASRNDETRANIIAEIFDKKKRDVMVNLDPDHITMVDTEKIVARIIVQTSRTTGLACVYDSLIGFSGSEIYFHQDKWKDITFGDLQFHFRDGIPIGVSTEAGKITLNPTADYRFLDGDSVIIIAEDDSTIKYSSKKLYEPKAYRRIEKTVEKKTEKELIIGWNSKARIIIDEYTDYILPGSVIHIVLPNGETEGADIIRDMQGKYPNIKIMELKCNPLSMSDLAEVHPENYDNVIILKRIEEDTEKIDSTTITTLLLIKELFKQYTESTGKKVSTQIISEVMNSENLELVVRTGVNDSVISYQLISKIFAQIAENPGILDVYEDLFSEAGSEIYLKPIELYSDELPASLPFADFMLMAQNRGEVCIGYRDKSLENEVSENFGVRINIPKDEVIEPHKGDSLIVLAEDEL